MTKQDKQEVSIVLAPSAVDTANGWITFQLTEMYASVEKTSGGIKRFVRQTYAPESNRQIKVAYQMHLGAGPQPEDSVTPLEIEDTTAGFLEFIENAIDRANQNKKTGEW